MTSTTTGATEWRTVLQSMLKQIPGLTDSDFTAYALSRPAPESNAALASAVQDGGRQDGYRGYMASPVEHLQSGDSTPPEADPVAIRACLSPRLVAEFDAEWERVLDHAKATKDLVGVHRLLAKWRHLAYGEQRDPGSYYRVLAKAEQIMRTGENPTACAAADLNNLIRERLGH